MASSTVNSFLQGTQVHPTEALQHSTTTPGLGDHIGTLASCLKSSGKWWYPWDGTLNNQPHIQLYNGYLLYGISSRKSSKLRMMNVATVRLIISKLEPIALCLTRTTFLTAVQHRTEPCFGDPLLWLTSVTCFANNYSGHLATYNRPKQGSVKAPETNPPNAPNSTIHCAKRNGLRVEAPGGSNRHWSCWCRAHPLWRCQVETCWSPCYLQVWQRVSAIFLGEKRSSLPKTSWKKTKTKPSSKYLERTWNRHCTLCWEWAPPTGCSSLQTLPGATAHNLDLAFWNLQLMLSSMDADTSKWRIRGWSWVCPESWKLPMLHDPWQWQLAVLITWQNKHQKGENLQKM